MTISCCFYFRFLLAFTTVRSGANERFVISFMEAYFCTGNSNWIGKLDGDLKMYEGLFVIARPILCEKKPFTIPLIKEILGEMPNYMKMAKKKYNTWEKCLLGAFMSFFKSKLCDEKDLRFGVEIWRSYCLTLSCKNSWVWNRIEDRGLKIAADSSFCTKSGKHNRRHKRQFDAASFYHTLEVSVCGERFEAVIKELSAMTETGGYLTITAHIWANLVCCLNDN